MRKINEIIIVEGKHDADFLRTFLSARIIETGGTSLNKETIELIKRLAPSNNFIILTDPDFPGNYIRNKLLEIIPNAKIGNIRKGNTRKPGTIGVENATKEEIEEVLDGLISYSDYEEKITNSDLYVLGLNGQKDSSRKRKIICDYYYLGECNAKTFLIRINLLSSTRDEILFKIKELLNEK